MIGCVIPFRWQPPPGAGSKTPGIRESVSNDPTRQPFVAEHEQVSALLLAVLRAVHRGRLEEGVSRKREGKLGGDGVRTGRWEGVSK